MTSLLKREDLEILIATKNKSSLAFLESMFPFEHFSNFNVLIINQSGKNVLTSNFDTIRVINTNEKGLSKSRNLAINNAIKPICLITDDDVVFEEKFNINIVSAFTNNPKSDIITFNHLRIGNSEPQKKWKKPFKHNSKSIWNVSSIEIAFLLDEIKKNKIYFDENFGLCSFFETAEEFLFLKLALQRKLKVTFFPKIIVSHPAYSSGKNEGSDSLIFARAALFYKIYGKIAYVWLAKYIFFLVRNRYIKKTDIFNKWGRGCAGISKFENLNKLTDDN